MIARNQEQATEDELPSEFRDINDFIAYNDVVGNVLDAKWMQNGDSAFATNDTMFNDAAFYGNAQSSPRTPPLMMSPILTPFPYDFETPIIPDLASGSEVMAVEDESSILTLTNREAALIQRELSFNGTTTRSSCSSSSAASAALALSLLTLETEPSMHPEGDSISTLSPTMENGKYQRQVSSETTSSWYTDSSSIPATPSLSTCPRKLPGRKPKKEFDECTPEEKKYLLKKRESNKEAARKSRLRKVEQKNLLEWTAKSLMEEADQLRDVILSFQRLNTDIITTLHQAAQQKQSQNQSK